MRWGKENKRKLRDYIRSMKENHKARDWDRFLDSLGIKKVEREAKRINGRMAGFSAWTYEECGEIARAKDRIIVNDYFFLEGVGWCWEPCIGLSVSKDIAERFLILGVQ